MKRFLSTSFIALVLVISAAGAAPAAHAATCTAGYVQDVNNDYFQSDGTTPCTLSANSGTAAISNASATISCPPGQVEGAGEQSGQCFDASGNATSATPTDPAAAATPNPLKDSPPIGGVLAQVLNWIMSLFAWLLGVAAILLDNAVFYTVVTMGDYVNHLSAIGVTWRILRDIGNIMLIFGFLAVGITTILNVDWYGGGKKMLPMMFVAAVFLNFSLFISEAVIDTGNLFATQFYTQINGGNPAGAKNFDLASVSNEGISNKIMTQLGLATIYSNARTNANVLPDGTSVFIAFMSCILFIVASFVMFSLAFVLIARFVALVFLIMIAPIGFAGLAIPGFAARAKDWWTQLFHQTITAPILLLMLYLALAVITDANFLGFGPKGDWTGFVPDKYGATNFTGFAGIMLAFLVAMGLLVSVVVYAKRWSAFGGDWASKMGAKLSFGLTAAGMRSTVGFGSQYLAQKVRTNKTLQKYGKTSRLLTSALDQGAKGSFDLRGTGVLKNIPFGSNIDAGEAQKGGYKAAREASIKSHEEYVKSVQAAIDEKGATAEEASKIKAHEVEKDRLQGVHDEAEKAQEEAKKKYEPQIAERQAEVDRLQKEKERNDRFAPGSTAARETERQLEAARQALNASRKPFVKASEDLDKAQRDLREAIKAETDAVKKSTDRIGTEKRQAAVAYAESISGYGPSANVAAKKILKDARTSADKKLLDQLNKAIKAGNIDSGAGEKPAASASASTAPAH
ncbi:MAG: hypothetical protein Q7R58_02280 [bacterium]|nr:hypothetical protein [bacterium]